MYSEDSPYKQLPFLSQYEQLLVEYWHEIGFVSQTTGGITALSWNEIVTWANQFYSETVTEYIDDGCGVFIPQAIQECTLLDYELKLIRQLSLEYSSEYSAATVPSRPCPKEIDLDALSEEVKLAESNALGQALLELFGKKEDE